MEDKPADIASFWVQFTYRNPGVPEDEPATMKYMGMDSHPIQGDTILYMSYYYRVAKVTYDMDQRIISIECERL